jgi:hypothetical protein
MKKDATVAPRPRTLQLFCRSVAALPRLLASRPDISSLQLAFRIAGTPDIVLLDASCVVVGRTAAIGRGRICEASLSERDIEHGALELLLVDVGASWKVNQMAAPRGAPLFVQPVLVACCSLSLAKLSEQTAGGSADGLAPWSTADMVDASGSAVATCEVAIALHRVLVPETHAQRVGDSPSVVNRRSAAHRSPMAARRGTRSAKNSESSSDSGSVGSRHSEQSCGSRGSRSSQRSRRPVATRAPISSVSAALDGVATEVEEEAATPRSVSPAPRTPPRAAAGAGATMSAASPAAAMTTNALGRLSPAKRSVVLSRGSKRRVPPKVTTRVRVHDAWNRSKVENRPPRESPRRERHGGGGGGGGGGAPASANRVARQKHVARPRRRRQPSGGGSFGWRRKVAPQNRALDAEPGPLAPRSQALAFAVVGGVDAGGDAGRGAGVSAGGDASGDAGGDAPLSVSRESEDAAVMVAAPVAPPSAEDGDDSTIGGTIVAAVAATPIAAASS